MNPRIPLLSVLAAAALVACSSVPESNNALEQARGSYKLAQGDPQVAKLAPDELKRASDALGAADRAWAAKAATASVDHLAYLTSQRVVIAQETASSRAAQAVTAGAGAERDQMRLAQRTAEAEAAQLKLAASQQSDARKTTELAAADAAAARDQAQVAKGDARVSELELQLKELNAKKTAAGMVVTLGDVLFDSGRWQLLPAGAADMAKLADVFKQDPRRRASIEGYTDSVGGAYANVELSGRRANAVMVALVDLGVPADRRSTRAHGAADPAATNATAAGRQIPAGGDRVLAAERRVVDEVRTLAMAVWSACDVLRLGPPTGGNAAVLIRRGDAAGAATASGPRRRLARGIREAQVAALIGKRHRDLRPREVFLKKKKKNCTEGTLAKDRQGPKSLRPAT